MKLLRWLALEQHCQEGTGKHLLPDEEAARLTVANLAETNQEKASLEDFLKWSAQRRWSSADLKLDPSRREAWINATKTLAEQPQS